MTVKFRYVDLTTGTSHNGAGAVTGEARGRIGLGATYGKVCAVEFKGDDANVDNNNTLTIADAEGRQILAATVIDAGDTTYDEYTSQVAVIGGLTSTVGALFAVGYPEDQYLDSEADFSANTEGMNTGIYAKSPLTVTILLGTDGDVQRVGVWVEV